MRNSILKSTIVILLLLCPLAARADVIWPSIYIVQQYYAWYVILAGWLIEVIAARIFLKTTWKKSFVVMTVANAISALLGVILIPCSGILVEMLTIPFGGGTFHITHWILDYLCVVIVNTIVEGAVLRTIFKIPIQSNYWWLVIANLISVIICLFAVWK